MHKKYIPIIALLSIILFGNETFAQKGKKSQAKRGANNRLAAKRNAQNKTAKQPEPETVQTEITATAEVTPLVDTSNIQTEIERLTAENTLLRNKINEKQTEFNKLDSTIEELSENLQNLQYKQNRSKSACSQMSLKKMDDIRGWLIATVASSGLGTVANATATVTTFMQKDEKQIDKQNQKAIEKATEKAKNQEIQNLRNEQKAISDKIADNNITLNQLDIPTGDDLYDTLDTKGIEYLTKQNQEYSETYNEYEEKINDVQNNPFTGEINAKTTSYEKQEKKNKTLSTVSNISSIVGTVASGASVITSGVATAMIATIIKQVKSCKETF